MSCSNKLSGNINYDCTPAKKAKAGLEKKAVIINRADLDMTALTVSGAMATNISLFSGATGYSVETIKQLHNSGAAYAANDAGADKYNHSYIGRIWGQGVADAERAKELKDGEFIVIVQTLWGAGTNEAFKVFGLEGGLRMTEATFTSIENDGALLFTLSSDETFGGESYPFQIWNEGNYASTKAKFDNLLAE